MIAAFLLAVSQAAAPDPGKTVLQVPPSTGAPQTPQQIPPEELAFGVDDTRMTVPVTIREAADGAAIAPDASYRFVVDTGSERTVLSQELAAILRLAGGRPVKVTAMAGTVSTPTVVVPALVVGTPNVGAHFTGTRIEAPLLLQRHLGAAGLVGIDTLQGKAVGIDFARKIMTVTTSTRRTRREVFGPDDIVVRAKSLSGQLVVTDAQYGGRRIRVVLDTGSVISMGNIALQRLVAKTTGPLSSIKLLSVTGAMLDADYAIVTGVRIGAIGLANLPIAFSDAAPFARLGLRDRPALLLGMDALRLFGHVRIDFANREIRLAYPVGAPPPL